MTWLVVLLIASTADLEPRPTHVDFTAPDTCPARDAFERELSARTDRVRFVETSEATASVSVVVTKKGRRFEGRLEVKTSDGASSRKTLQSPKCETLVGALTLLAALVLDPEGAKLGPVSTAPPPSLPPFVSIASPVALPLPPPVIVEGPRVPIEPPPAPKTPELVLDTHVLAAFVVSNGVSGQLDLGAGARVGLELGPNDQPFRFTASLSGAGLTGRTMSSDAGRVRYAARFLGELEAGAAFLWKALRVQVAAFAQLAPVFLEGLDGDDLFTSQRFLWALGPSARVGLQWGPWQLGVRAGAAIALRRESYVIDPTGLVFGVPAVAFAGAVELGRSVP